MQTHNDYIKQLEEQNTQQSNLIDKLYVDMRNQRELFNKRKGLLKNINPTHRYGIEIKISFGFRTEQNYFIQCNDSNYLDLQSTKAPSLDEFLQK
jgi:hypothetical protein